MDVPFLCTDLILEGSELVGFGEDSPGKGGKGLTDDEYKVYRETYLN